jgi:hypothetical protein
MRISGMDQSPSRVTVARQVWLHGDRDALSEKEFALLGALAAEPTRLFTREELLRGASTSGDGNQATLKPDCRISIDLAVSPTPPKLALPNRGACWPRADGLLAHHHPQLLGALEPELFQMAEDVGGHQTLHGPGGIARADERSACKAHASDRRSRMLGEAPSTLRAEDLIDEFNQRSMILIVTHNLLKAPWAATPIVGLLDGERVEHREFG